MRSAPRVRYAAASSGQSASTTVVRTGASEPITSGSARMATSSGIGSSPALAITSPASVCKSASDFHSPQLTTVAGRPMVRRA